MGLNVNDVDFMEEAKKNVVLYMNKIIIDEGEPPVDTRSVFLVWYSKTIQNAKVILGVRGPNFLLFEITYNGNVEDMYMDVYNKVHHETISYKDVNVDD